eukprot:6476938-Amphidinium_carterae.1
MIATVLCLVCLQKEKSGSALQIGENREHMSSPGRWLLFDAACPHGFPPFEGSRDSESVSSTIPLGSRRNHSVLVRSCTVWLPVKEWVRWSSCKHPALCWTSSQPLGSTASSATEKHDVQPRNTMNLVTGVTRRTKKWELIETGEEEGHHG